MTLSVFTNSQIISLQGNAASVFLHTVLTPDANNTIEAVQTYEEVMMTRSIALPLGAGIDEVNKKMILSGMADLEVGDRFLCNAAVIDDINSNEAQYYLRLVANLNNGQDLTPEQAQAKTRIESDEIAFMSRVEDAKE